MLRHLSSITSLMLGIGLLLLGNGLLSTLIVMRGKLEGFSEQMLGLIGSAYFVGFLLGAYLVPPLIRRMGHIRAFSFFAAAIAAFMLLYPLLIHPWAWMALRLLTGIALVGFYTVIESWLNSQAEPEWRGQVFAVYMAVNMIATAVAQQFLRVADPMTFVLFSVAAMLACFSVMPVSATRLPPPPINNVPRLTFRKMWAAAPIAVLGAVASGLVIGSFWSLTPLYAIHLGLDTGGIATLMTVIIAGGALMQWPLGRFSDRLDRRTVLAAVSICAALAATVMAFFGHYEWVLMIAAFLYGGMAFSVYPIVVAHLIDHLSQDEILSGNAAVLLLYGMGAALGPALSGFLMSKGGTAAFPGFFTVVLSLLAIYTLFVVRTHVRDEIVEEAAQFVPMVRTASIAMEMAAAVEEHRIETVAMDEKPEETLTHPSKEMPLADEAVAPTSTDEAAAALAENGEVPDIPSENTADSQQEMPPDSRQDTDKPEPV